MKSVKWGLLITMAALLLGLGAGLLLFQPALPEPDGGRIAPPHELFDEIIDRGWREKPAENEATVQGIEPQEEVKRTGSK